MDWKKEAAEKLKDYETKKAALRSIPMERERLRCVMEGIHSAGVDGDPVKGSTNRREDRLLNCIVALEELELTEKQTKAWLDAVDCALHALNQEERLILDRFYINPAKGNVDRLCGELFVEKTQVYRKKDATLRRFTLALYGCTES